MSHAAASLQTSTMTPANKPSDRFRDFTGTSRESVRNLYAANHQGQTLDFVLAKKSEYLPLRRQRAGMWRVLERLSEVVDQSDCDIELPQIVHALQTAEALRRDGHPRWLILTGLIHDAGKVLALYDEPQWAVVGDTFPVGCAFADEVVHHQLFQDNPDTHSRRCASPLGIYSEGCGLADVHMSWGHDEYLFHVVKDYVPPEAAYIIRFHSFYAAHNAGAYGHLMNEYDRLMMRWVRLFSSYDLYSKDAEPPVVADVEPFYRELIDEFLPAELAW